MAYLEQLPKIISRLVKPTKSQLSTRETIEAHADHICRQHNSVILTMIEFLNEGTAPSVQIKEWAETVDRSNTGECVVMCQVLTSALLPMPVFQGASDAAALETYGRLLLNLYSLEVLGSPATV